MSVASAKLSLPGAAAEAAPGMAAASNMTEIAASIRLRPARHRPSMPDAVVELND
jgi:hypothetical protein